MTKQARGRGFDKAKGGKKRDKAVVRQFAGLLLAIDGFVHPEHAVRPLSAPVLFGEGGEAKARENLGGVVIEEYFDEERVGVGRT